jgi:hypothetical protein
VNRVDPTFLVFDDVVKKAMNNDNNAPSILGNASVTDGDATLVSVSTQTGDAAVVTLATACLRLNCSQVKDVPLTHLLFARVYFFNRAKLMPFPIHLKNSSIDLSPQAKVHLHGRRLLDLMTPSQEAFIRFVVLVDCMRYHGLILRNFSNGEGGDSDDKEELIEFMANYKGPMNSTLPASRHCPPKIIKGYRSPDIALYLTIKKKVLEERHHVKTVLSELDDATETTMASNGFPTNCFNVSPFTFYFPGHEVKEERNDKDASKQRKYCAPPLINIHQSAMELDDDDYFQSPKIPKEAV